MDTAADAPPRRRRLIHDILLFFGAVLLCLFALGVASRVSPTVSHWLLRTELQGSGAPVLVSPMGWVYLLILAGSLTLSVLFRWMTAPPSVAPRMSKVAAAALIALCAWLFVMLFTARSDTLRDAIEADNVGRMFDLLADVDHPLDAFEGTLLEGLTPLAFASHEGSSDCVKALIGVGGAWADQMLPDGRSAVLLAAGGVNCEQSPGGSAEALHALLDAGYPIAGVDHRERGPLAAAVAVGEPLRIRLLLERGADPLQESSQGMTPVDFAEWHQGELRDEIRALFEQHATEP